jgi:hypothetical protein
MDILASQRIVRQDPTFMSQTREELNAKENVRLKKI